MQQKSHSVRSTGTAPVCACHQSFLFHMRRSAWLARLLNLSPSPYICVYVWGDNVHAKFGPYIIATYSTHIYSILTLMLYRGLGTIVSGGM